LWVRIVVQLALVDRSQAVAVRDGRVVVHPGVLHVLTRHAPVPLVALRTLLQRTCVADVVRVSRARVGPFWFPGLVLPAGVPGELGRGLLLHLDQDVIGHDVRTSLHADPWRPAPDERLPAGHGRVVERRFAGSSELRRPLEAWAAASGVPLLFTPLDSPAGGAVR